MMLGGSNGTPWFRASKLEMLVQSACDPTLHEPNYAIHLEIAELINTKKANTPREAAMLIAHLSNHRNPHIAILALALLDTVVQSCGYPFHLQISTKEFLNELVRRFPERPPPFPGPVMSRILELIHRWKEGICSDSRWKEDLGNIKDMHRLLTFKGYRFREIPRRVEAPPTMNIKSADELESEDREAQSAKLQELIRRGTPRDLVAAQELMKSLAGANPEAKPDYRSQAMTELNKLESKVILLNEMLDKSILHKGRSSHREDAYDQVASILKSARPKLQKWVSDAETDDPESLDAFLQINDRINNVKGDYSISAVPAELAQTRRNVRLTTQRLLDEQRFSSSTSSPFRIPHRHSPSSGLSCSRLPHTRITSPSYFGGNNGGYEPSNSSSSFGRGPHGLGMSRPPATGMST
ncbi:VHS domain-containing protein, partial [Suillus subalutaceus]|uniref:VHS domain-containing protein n=1 Tax=Suillus subalutaceus TaxID=48586 RepID=UPI001B87D028